MQVNLIVYSVCLEVLVLITAGIALRVFLEWRRIAPPLIIENLSDAVIVIDKQNHEDDAKTMETLANQLATFPKDGDTHTNLLNTADNAELMAKRLGKNQIVLASSLKT